MTRKEKLFVFFSEEHDLTLLDGQIDDIIHAVENSAWKDPKESMPLDGEYVQVYNPDASFDTNRIKTLRYHKSEEHWFKKTFKAWRVNPVNPNIN